MTIVVTTLDGREQLARCLTALAALDYPADRLSVVVVDNASSDGTPALVRDHFPSVQLIRSACNLGFAGGSNRGFAEAATDFVATLNNDVTVSPRWLRDLMRPALDDQTVGLCTGKLIFARDRLRVRVTTADDTLELGRGPIQAWVDGAPAAVERVGAPVSLDLGIWIDPVAHPETLRLKLDARPGTAVDVTIVGIGLPPARIGSDQTLELPMPVDAVARAVIQNAGTIVFRDGRGRDRGAVLDEGLHYYVDDLGQYDHDEEVFAGCGAGLLIRAAALADVGAFDERYFAYYEDVDLCWRARLRGWRVAYAPGAVARHVHRATTSRWSGRFVYYTERNRLMMLGKLAPFDRAIGQLGRAVALAARSSAATPYRWARRADPRGAWAAPRAAALASLARYFPGLLADRARIQGRRRVAQTEIDRWFAD